MDLEDLRDLAEGGSGCGGKNCGLTSGFSENCSNQDCLWEEPMFGLIELVCVTVIYIPLMLFGLLGNLLTILVVWLRPHMRSSTYLYLSSMAVSDLLILLLLPLDLYKLWKPRPWPLGDLACKLTMFLSECCTFCTILHITFLSLERYLAVCWPITAKTVVTRRRTRVIIGCLWLGAAVSAAPVLIMVGVEEVGGEELALSQWREEGGWTGRDGEQGGLMIDGGEREGAHMAMLDARLDEIKLGEKETREWDGEVNEWKERGEISEMKEGKGADEEASEQDWKSEFVGERQNKKKEDEGGGRVERVDGSHEGELDRRECRCTQYAISSGLLSAMMILSNLYFLVPLCILGLVYSLIGRTLWLRPKSSRRDQSHRNTVKMLGVIVLAFVLCWLPFHVGRTILSLSLGSSAGGQEITTDFHSDPVSDVRNDISMQTDSDPLVHSDPEEDSESFSRPGQTAVDALRLCDLCGRTKVKGDHLDTDEYFDSLNRGNTDINVQNQHPDMNTDTQIETHNDSALVNTQRGSFFDSINRKQTFYNSSNTSTPDSFHTAAPADLNVHTDTSLNDTHSHPDAHVYFLYYLSQYFNLVSSVLFYLSAAVNPLLYNLMSARYRLAVHSLIHKNSQTHTQRLHTLAARHSTTTL